MASIVNGRISGEIDGDFVLFLIGVRFNKPWKFWRWLPVFRAMPKMLSELSRDPALGLIHYRVHPGFPNTMIVQYWRSFDLLTAYAQSRDKAHLPAWRAFNKMIGNNGDVGIWHETYLIAPGKAESIYVNMPPFGLALAGAGLQAGSERDSAKQRLGAGGRKARLL